MNRVRRQVCCGFNVAANCVGGPGLLIGVPLLVIMHMKAVVLTPELAGGLSDVRIISASLAELFVSIMTEVCLVLLLVADPGFLHGPTELSCRCNNCGIEVDDFDHHCDVLGVCIGIGNMCYFVLFLLFASSLCVLGGLLNIVYITINFSPAKVNRIRALLLADKAGRATAISEIFTIHSLCMVTLTAAAMYGGVACVFLFLRYFYLCYQGRYSFRRRRRDSLRGSLFDVFRNVFHPMFSHNNRGLVHQTVLDVEMLEEFDEYVSSPPHTRCPEN